MNTYADQFLESPLVNSYDTKPRRHYANLSEPSSLFHSPSSSDGSSSFKPYKEDSEKGQKKKHGKKNNSFACRIREHVKLGPKLSETVKGKLQLGAKIIQGGGRENIFRQIFGIREGEQMLKASQCYLFTTAGPIAGLLFISTEKVAFCSERSITVPSPTGQFIRTPYKVVIPVSKIQRASQSENEENTTQKYIEIVTEDNFEFWFMGFLRYEKAFHNLQKAISMASRF
ncbi:putative GEM-like protein 8 [Juglans microcarpa x Juglans regia]|uniref:putative GEM-like protein 8 n=1 Tax=Juglans microcarpa x Juglans regia TaxID=2249226 RepID=UPI001B7E33AB|nr:putative GEM-like protein 8 [Juglans microcarpa x Juglans regia]